MRRFFPPVVALLLFAGLACAPQKAHAALSYVGSAEGSGTDAAISVSLMGLSLQEGDLVIVANGWAASSDGDPGVGTAGYTEEADLYADDLTETNFSVSWKVMGAVPDTSVSCNGSDSTFHGSACEVHVWRGADAASRPDPDDQCSAEDWSSQEKGQETKELRA